MGLLDPGVIKRMFEETDPDNDVVETVLGGGGASLLPGRALLSIDSEAATRGVAE